jgi:hypothetical protein
MSCRQTYLDCHNKHRPQPLCVEVVNVISDPRNTIKACTNLPLSSKNITHFHCSTTTMRHRLAVLFVGTTYNEHLNTNFCSSTAAEETWNVFHIWKIPEHLPVMQQNMGKENTATSYIRRA